MSFLCWFIILKFVFHVLPLTLNFIYKYILATNWFCIIYIKHSCPLSHKHEQLLLKAHFQNPQFQGQKHLWTKCAQIDYKKKIHLFKSSMLKSSLIFKRNVAHMVKRKRTFKKNKDYSFSKFECFEHAKKYLIYVKLWACKLCN